MRFFGLAAALLFSGAFAAAAEGLVLRAPAVLYDAPSEQARALFILTAGYPLRQISRVDGWRKTALPDGETGWVREELARRKRAAVVFADLAAARFSPKPDAAEVFYARRGVVLEILNEQNGWLEVLHPDGETGFMAAADVRTNG